MHFKRIHFKLHFKSIKQIVLLTNWKINTSTIEKFYSFVYEKLTFWIWLFMLKIFCKIFLLSEFFIISIFINLSHKSVTFTKKIYKKKTNWIFFRKMKYFINEFRDLDKIEYNEVYQFTSRRFEEDGTKSTYIFTLLQKKRTNINKK